MNVNVSDQTYTKQYYENENNQRCSNQTLSSHFNIFLCFCDRCQKTVSYGTRNINKMDTNVLNEAFTKLLLVKNKTFKNRLTSNYTTVPIHL